MADKTIVEMLSKTQVLAPFSRKILEELAAHVTIKRFSFGEIIVSAGREVDGLLVVLHGRARLFGEEHEKEFSLGLLEPGETIGDFALIESGGQHEYSLRSSGTCSICFIPGDKLRKILSKQDKAYRLACRYALLRTVGGVLRMLLKLGPVFSKEEFDQIVTRIGTKRFHDGDLILRQDDDEDKRLYIISAGEANVSCESEGRILNISSVGRGQVFGMSSCIEGVPQPAKVVAVGETSVFVIPKELVRTLTKKSATFNDLLENENAAFHRNLERLEKLNAPEKKKRSQYFFGFWTPRSAKVLRRFTLVEQAEEMDCGAAVLAMLCRHYGIKVSLGKLRDMVNVTTEGASLASIAAAGESLGFRSRALKTSWEKLKDLDLPIIIHWQDYHYVVVHGISSDRIWLADPGEGFKQLSREEFLRGWKGMVLTLSPTAGLKTQVGTQTTWKKFYPYVEMVKSLLWQIFVASLLISLMGLVPPLIIQNIVDSVVVHQNVSFLNVLIIGMAVFSIFSIMTSSLRSFLSQFMSRRIDFQMLTTFFKHVLALPLSFFETRQTGDIIARFSENNRIRGFMTETMIMIILNVIMITVYLVLMFIYNVWLTLLTLAFFPFVAGITLMATPRYKAFARQIFQAGANQESTLVETIGGIDTVKGMGMEHSLRRQWEKQFAQLLNTQYKSGLFNIFVGGGSRVIQSVFSVLILWLGAYLVIKGKLTIGQLMAFNALMGSVTGPLMELVGVWDEFQEANVSLERIGDVLDMPQEQVQDQQGSKIILPDIEGHILLKNVYFRYGDKDTAYVLKNINLEIQPGTMVALVGKSGSGKSTLVKILLGFYKPVEGSITLDKYDMNSIDMLSYRRQVGYVMQNNLLFSGTVTSNIALGEEQPSAAQVREAARLADAHGFIKEMAMQYEQPVGERGITVSGGQRQRLCIARALYRKPRMLILDEATSSLDAESEALIQQNMRDILQGRTAIIVAHRLSTVRSADCIFALHNGQIAESGKHDELMARKGVYYHLIKQQMGNVDT